MFIRSYLNKTFSVRAPEARIRQSGNLLKYVVYGPADTLHPEKRSEAVWGDSLR
jgi:hypothetical protein